MYRVYWNNPSVAPQISSLGESTTEAIRQLLQDEPSAWGELMRRFLRWEEMQNNVRAGKEEHAELNTLENGPKKKQP